MNMDLLHTKTNHLNALVIGLLTPPSKQTKDKKTPRIRSTESQLIALHSVWITSLTNQSIEVVVNMHATKELSYTILQHVE